MAAPSVEDLNSRLRARSSRGVEQQRSVPSVTGAHSRRRGDIQGLRAVAILLVVAFHAGLPVPGGFMGVDVFFAISGFVITAMLVAELEPSGRLDLPRFYVRRARRLLPALALMLTFVLLAGALISPLATQHMTALTGVAASVFAANGYLLNLGTGYFDVGTDLNPLLHTWTLAVEEQFYIVFPALLLVSWQLGARRRAFGSARAAAALTLGAVCAGSFLLSLSLSGGWLSVGAESPERLAFYGSPTRAWEFGAGALLALATPWMRGLSVWPVRIFGLAGVAAIGLAAFSSREVWAVPGTAFLLPVLGTCALIAAGAASCRAPSRALSARPLVWIGDLSYSWYLWHWPLIVFAKALWPDFGAAPLAAAALSVLPAWFSLRFVENPIRFGLRFKGRAFAAAAVACVLLPIAASVGLLQVRNALAANPTMRSWTRSQALHADVVKGCDNPYPLSERQSGACVWTVPAALGNVVLVGDSAAGQYTEPVAEAARQARVDLTVATFSSCPFIDVGVLRAAAFEGEALCRRFNIETLDALVRIRPSLVITAARSDQYIEDDSVRLRDRSGRLTRSPDQKALLWELGLQRTISALDRAGVPVLVVRPVPMFPQAAQSCTTLDILTNGCANSVSVERVESRLRRAAQAEMAAVGTIPSAFTIDFENRVCARDRCSTSRQGTILYRDSEHLSVDGALRLTGDFYRAIVAHARTATTPEGGISSRHV
jgi:peptidoglycan/LPS O-acetylase OafA/YrhL